jgi:uncharacterized phage protein (TIGR01671 family)
MEKLITDMDIQFRAWDSIQSKMFYLTNEHYLQIHSDSSWTLMQIAEPKDIVLTSNIELFSSIYNGELMQYIGWNDKYDKEIYFGDIIKYKTTWYEDLDEDNEFGTAIIIRGLNCGAGIQRSFGYNHNNKPDVHKIDGEEYYSTYADLLGDGTDFWEDTNIFDVEVVGNIYQTPHLINH